MQVKKVIKICPRCGMESEITRDHVIPQWFRLSAPYFGLTHSQISEKAELGKSMRQKLCAPCNYQKNGQIEWDDTDVQKYMKAFLLLCYDKIQEQVKKPIKIMVKCECNSTPKIIEEVKAIHQGQPTPSKPVTSISAHIHWKDRFQIFGHRQGFDDYLSKQPDHPKAIERKDYIIDRVTGEFELLS